MPVISPCKQEDCKYFQQWHGEYDMIPVGSRILCYHIFRCLFCSKFTRKDLYEPKGKK